MKKLIPLLAALVLLLACFPSQCLALTTNFLASFETANGTSNATPAALNSGTAIGSWSFQNLPDGADGAGAISSNAANRAYTLAYRSTGVPGMQTMMLPNNFVNLGSYPTTYFYDASGTNGTRVFAQLASAGTFTGTNQTLIGFKWGAFATANSSLGKGQFVRGLDALGNEIFKLLFLAGNFSSNRIFYARGADETNITLINTSVGIPSGTPINPAGASSTTWASATVGTDPTEYLQVTVLLTNSQVRYTVAHSGIAGSPVTTGFFPVNSSATNLARLEFSAMWSSTANSQFTGFWLDDLLVTTSEAGPPAVIPIPVTWRATADNFWNTTSTNWVDTATGTTNVTFLDTEAVTFTDTTANATVIITNTVLPGAITVNNTASNYVFTGSGSIGGGGGLTKSGTGSLLLATTNNAFGPTTINAGTVKAGAPGALPIANVTVNGTLDLGGYDVSVNGLSGSGTVTNSAASGTNTLLVGLGGGSSTFNGVIRDSVGGAATRLAKTNTGTLTLNLPQAHRGETHVRNGTLAFGAENILPTNSLLNLGVSGLGANVAMNGYNQTLGGLVGTGAGTSGYRRVSNGSATPATLTLDVAAGVTCVYSNAVGYVLGDSNDNNFAVVKNGPGEQRLAVAVHTGSTTINNGRLIFTATGVSAVGATGPVTVNAGGTLGGNGELGGAVSLLAGGILAPGISGIGALRATNGVTLAGESVFEINATTADRLISTNGATITLGGTLTVTNLAGATLTNGTVYQLFQGPLAGGFTAINLPGNPARWDTSELGAGGDGTLTLLNNAPTASHFTLGVPAGGTVEVSVTGKYAYDVDAGDVVTVTAVSAPANGTVNIISGTNLLYTSTNAAASDSFTYTVSDGLSSATGTVTVQTYNPQGFNRVSGPTPVGGGQYHIGYQGIPGHKYALDETDDLTPPIIWLPVVTNTAAGNGAVDFTVTPSFYPSGYFRTRHVP
ncbi:MAG: beta strand repeat-containing protein [Limisphaerales bacterium]